MLNYIRKQADSWMIKAILWLIVLAFVGTIFYSWGMGGRFGSRSQVVATVDGIEIKVSEFDRSFGNLVNFYRNQFGSQFSEEMIVKLNLKQNALDALIQNKLILLQAEKLNLQVSDTELADRISKTPAFHKDNRFSKSLYENFLSYNRLSPKEFEQNQREAMLREKIENFVTRSTPVSDAEVREAYNKENEKIKFQYIGFSKDYFKPATQPTDEEIRKFFEAHKQRFEMPERIKVQYVKLTPSMVQDQIEIYEEDIKYYYETHQAEFFIKKQYQASHILIKHNDQLPFGEDLTDEEKEKKLNEAEAQARKKAEDLLKQIQGGADFGEMAKKHSDDTASGANQGSLGQFSQGMMVSEFEAALDKLKPGELGGPVKTMFGFHIVKLDAVHEERMKPLAEVQEEIKKKLKEDKARRRIRRIAKKIRKAAGAGNNLVKAALKFKSTTQTTEFISRDVHNVPDIGNAPEFFNTAFSLTGEEVSEPVNTAEASYLLKVVARKQPYIPELNEVMSKVVQALIEENNKTFTEQKMKSLSERLKTDGDLDKLAAELNLEVEETPYFSRMDSIPGIGNIESIKNAVFPLQPGQTTSGSSRSIFYLIKMKERLKAEAPDKDSTQKIYDRLKKEKSRRVFQEWMDGLKEKADILIDRKFL